MNNADRELLKMALDALLHAVPQTSEQAQEQSRSIVALQDRLAQPEPVAQCEPVGVVTAWWQKPSGKPQASVELSQPTPVGTKLYTNPQPAVHGEPVGWVAKSGHGTYFRETITDDLKSLSFAGRPYWRPVSYTHPQPERVPLTDEQIGAIFDPRNGASQGVSEVARRFARAIEAAHGIQGGQR